MATLYFSNTTHGFYNSDVHGTNIPSDSVELDPNLYTALLAGQTAGQIITWSTGSNAPTLTSYVAPPPPAVTKITPLEFKARFDSSTWGGILSAAMTDPVVLGWVFTASAATYIDLTNSETTLGLTYLSTRSPSLLAASLIPVLLAY